MLRTLGTERESSLKTASDQLQLASGITAICAAKPSRAAVSHALWPCKYQHLSDSSYHTTSRMTMQPRGSAARDKASGWKSHTGLSWYSFYTTSQPELICTEDLISFPRAKQSKLVNPSTVPRALLAQFAPLAGLLRHFDGGMGSQGSGARSAHLRPQIPAKSPRHHRGPGHKERHQRVARLGLGFRRQWLGVQFC